MNDFKGYIYNLSYTGDDFLGSKFSNLCVLKGLNYNIPNAICISSLFLNREIEKYISDLDSFNNLFIEIESTAGCYLLDTYPLIEKAIKGFKLSKEGQTLILDWVETNFGISTGKKYAVRSSAVHEDGKISSFAGIYQTTLNANTIEDIYIAIENAIIQYYSYPAIIARIRNNIYSSSLELNLIVQEMINPNYAGVAFSKSVVSNNDVLVEWVDGLGEQLVSGEKTANIYYKGGNFSYEHNIVNMCEKIIETVNKIKDQFAYEVDVEWCYEIDKLFILQVRAITDNLVVSESTESIFEINRLYFDTEFEYADKLGNCKNVYLGYTKKRSEKYLKAKNCNINTGKGYVLRFNYEGVKNNKNFLLSICEGNYFEKFDIDVDDTIRQNIIKKEDFLDYLDKIFGNERTKVQTMIVREFISGQYGVISHLIDDNKVYIECSKNGLLSINRGLANCCNYVVDESNCNSTILDEKCVSDIVRFTKVLSKNKARFMIEWAICDDKAFFIDYSEESIGEGLYTKNNYENLSRIIMPGNISGPIYYLSNSDVLEKLSISPGVSVNDTNDILLKNPNLNKIINEIKKLPQKPIVFTEKPFAILSFLMEYVEGFVFKQGALLCHLSIILRENRKPSIIYPEFDSLLSYSGNVMIIDGNITKC